MTDTAQERVEGALGQIHMALEARYPSVLPAFYTIRDELRRLRARQREEPKTRAERFAEALGVDYTPSVQPTSQREKREEGDRKSHQLLRDCVTALESLDKMALGRDPEHGYPYRDELLDAIRGHLAATPQREGEREPDMQDLAVADVIAERVRQDEKWGAVENRTHLTVTDLVTILTEEVGELAEAALELRYGQSQSSDIGLDMRSEAVQVAAVGLFIVEWIDLARDPEPPAERESE